MTIIMTVTDANGKEISQEATLEELEALSQIFKRRKRKTEDVKQAQECDDDNEASFDAQEV